MMGQAASITTSWDDGHPLDLRVAELLAKYGIGGTFYVPRTAERETMTGAQLRALGSGFELGAHTLHHVVLTAATEQDAWQEISGSKFWVEDSTGAPCSLFCPPKGRYADRHLEMIRRAGYRGLRSVELGSLDFPRWKAGLLSMPTTVQAYPHRLIAVARNAVKRASLGNLWRFVRHGGLSDWSLLVESLLRRATTRGGVFHLWGHSWELQEADHWGRLDEALRLMSQVAGRVPRLTNGEICRRALPARASPEDPRHEAETVGGGRRETAPPGTARLRLVHNRSGDLDGDPRR